MDGVTNTTQSIDLAPGGLAEGTLATDPATDSVQLVTDTLRSVSDTDPVQTVTDTLQSVTDPVQTVSETAQPVTDTLQSVTDPVQGVADPVQGVADPVQLVAGALQNVTDPVRVLADTLQSATDPVQLIADTLRAATETLQSVTDPVQLVTNTVQQVADAVQPVTETVQPVTDAVQPVTDPVQPVTDTVQPVADTVQPVADTVQPVTDAVEPLAGAAGGAVGTATQTAGSLTDPATVGATVEKTAAQTTAALDGASEPVQGALGHVTAESAALSEKVATTLAGTGGPGGVLGGPGDTFGGPDGIPGLVGENVLGTGIADVGEPASGNGGAFDVIPFEAPGLIAGAEEALILSAALATLAGVALVVRPSAVMSAQFFLANVRQIPACGGVREIVNRHVSAAAAGTARLGGASAGAVKGSAGAVKGITEDFARDIRDGFLRGVTGSTDDGASDTRLLMQIGMLLGAVYLAFLTVWYWATRLRWNPRT